MNAQSGTSGVDVDMEPLMVATRTINAVIVRSLAAVDDTLTVPQLRVLVILARTERASLTEVARDLGVNPSNASRTCDQLVRQGLVDRSDDPSDRRRLALSLSTAGRLLVRRVMESRRQLLEVVVAAMSAKDQVALMKAIASFNRATEDVGGVELSTQRPGLRPGGWLV